MNKRLLQGLLLVSLCLTVDCFGATSEAQKKLNRNLFNAVFVGAGPVAKAIARGGNVNAQLDGKQVKGAVPVGKWLRMGATSWQKVKTGDTPLMLAVKQRKLGVVQSLTAVKGIKIDMQNATGNTALKLAVNRGFELIINHLIEKGANVNLATTDGYTALHNAVKHSNSLVNRPKFVRIIKKLLAKRADIEAKTKDKKKVTPIELATSKQVRDLLIEERKKREKKKKLVL